MEKLSHQRFEASISNLFCPMTKNQQKFRLYCTKFQVPCTCTLENSASWKCHRPILHLELCRFYLQYFGICRAENRRDNKDSMMLTDCHIPWLIYICDNNTSGPAAVTNRRHTAAAATYNYAHKLVKHYKYWCEVQGRHGSQHTALDWDLIFQ